VRVIFTPDALELVREKRAWWLAHRDKAPRLFHEELKAVVARLRNGTDDTRKVYRVGGPSVIWRTLMPKTKLFVYYRINERDQEVNVLLVDNAIGDNEPVFSS
jgi:hypothetical protein